MREMLLKKYHYQSEVRASALQVELQMENSEWLKFKNHWSLRKLYIDFDKFFSIIEIELS